MSYQNPQYSQYGAPQQKSHTKLIAFIIVIAVLLPVLGLAAFFFITKQQQADYIDKTEQYTLWDVNGGYAENDTDVDSGLQARLETQEAFRSELDAEYGVEGYFHKTNVTQLASGQPRDEITGKPAPDSTASVDLDFSLYLNEDAELENVVTTVEDILTERGYEVKVVELTPKAIYMTTTREVPASSEGVDFYEEELRIDFTLPSSISPHMIITVLDYTNYKLEYPLSGIPVWSGLIDPAEFEAGGSLSWVKTGIASKAEICGLEENTYYGYWDARYDCLERS